MTVDAIASIGNKLWDDLVGNTKSMNVSCVQLGFSGIEAAEVGQQSIEGFLKAPKRPRGYDSDDSEDLTVLGKDVVGEAVENDLGDMIDASFTCSRCGKVIRLHKGPISHSGEQEALANLKLEHDDFHFAQDLAKGPDNVISSSTIRARPSTQRKTKRRKEESRGIEKFFSRK